MRVCVEGVGERWHERKGVAGGKLNLAQDVTAPGNSGCVYGENHDTAPATIRITHGWWRKSWH